MASGRWVWINGEIREAGEISVPIWTNALHYGTGVFEGIRCYPTPQGPAVFRLLDHLERLHRSAAYYGLALRWSAKELTAATLDLLRREGLDGAYVRPLVLFGEGPPQLAVKRGCTTEAMIMTRPMGAFLGEENYRRGIRLTVSTWRKTHCSTLPTTAKGSGQYLNSVIAAHEATDRGYDDALLLTVEGMVSECSGANIFCVRGGRLLTNDATSSILPGITRDSVIEICRREGIAVEVRTFALPELLEADEVFITGTAAEVTPVRAIEGKSFATGEHTLTYRLQQKYREIVTGQVAGYEAWLSYVLSARSA